jgi:uncharacterized protein (DUF1919 family)
MGLLSVEIRRFPAQITGVPIERSMPFLFELYRRRKRFVGRRIARRLGNPLCSIIADNCWAGELYSYLNLRCCSPFIGMGFRPGEYLDFLAHVREPGALDILGVSSEEKGYPVIRTRHARLFGQHYATDEEFRTQFERRRKAIRWDDLAIKIDFGIAGYRREHIEQWNRMRLPRAIAFFPDRPHYHALRIHQGVAMPDLGSYGSRHFTLCMRYVDIFRWLRDGTVTTPPPSYRLWHFLLVEKFPLTRLLQGLKPHPEVRDRDATGF